MSPYHWSDEQDLIHESVSHELLEGWNYGPDELARIEQAEAFAAELAEVEADAELLAAAF